MIVANLVELQLLIAAVSRRCEIIQNNSKTNCIVSAFGGVTNMIQESAALAANGDLKYQEILLRSKNDI